MRRADPSGKGNSSRKFFIDLLDAETGQRGYVLTHNPDYLEPYTRDRRRTAFEALHCRPAIPQRSVNSIRASASRCDGSSRRQRTPAAAASFFARRTVQQWTGIPVSVGIAPTKMLSKVANRPSCKQRSIFTIPANASAG